MLNLLNDADIAPLWGEDETIGWVYPEATGPGLRLHALGVLLPADKALPALIRQIFGEHGPMFRATDLEQWQKAEVRLREALREFAGAANATYQGRLFALDAAHSRCRSIA